MDKALQPPIGYWGGKIRLAHRIIGHFPKHRYYIEPFMGSMAVFLAKPLAYSNVLVDTNHHLVNFFHVLRERPDELLEKCRLTPHARAEFESARERMASGDVGDDLEHARIVWVILTQAFLQQTTTHAGWRSGLACAVPTDRTSIFDKLGDEFRSVAQKLRRCQIDSRDGLDVLEWAREVSDALIYCDPPYMHSTRKDDRTARYHTDPDDAWHARFLDMCQDAKAFIAISGYDNALYEEKLKGWRRASFNMRVGVNPKRERQDSKRQECLWMNYDHDRLF